jgi:2-methylcitrate dehydratase PrpD
MLRERLADSSTRALADRVELVEDPELTRLFMLSEAERPGGREAAVVHLVLDDGTKLSSEAVDNVLFPDPPTDTATIEAKFRWATSDVLPTGQAERVIEMCRGLESLGQVRELVSAATPPRPGP